MLAGGLKEESARYLGFPKPARHRLILERLPATADLTPRAGPMTGSTNSSGPLPANCAPGASSTTATPRLRTAPGGWSCRNDRVTWKIMEGHGSSPIGIDLHRLLNDYADALSHRIDTGWHRQIADPVAAEIRLPVPSGSSPGPGVCEAEGDAPEFCFR